MNYHDNISIIILRKGLNKLRTLLDKDKTYDLLEGKSDTGIGMIGQIDRIITRQSYELNIPLVMREANCVWKQTKEIK